MLRRPRVSELVAGYFVCLLVITTMPLFFDSVTSSLIAIGPLLLQALLGAYLVIHYLHLGSFLRLVAYFLAFVGIVSIPSGILGPVGVGANYPAGGSSPIPTMTNNSTVMWLHDFRSSCFLSYGQSTLSDSTGYYGLGYGGASSQFKGDCHGLGQFTTQTFSSGLFSNPIIRSSVWFMDNSFNVPDNGQKNTEVAVGGSVFLSGWLSRHAAGIGMYEGFTQFTIFVRLVGNAPCTVDLDCYSSYYAVRNWGAPQTFSSDYEFSGLRFLVVPGYSYNVVVSFNETSNTLGIGPSGVASVDTCFGYSSYCVNSETGPPLSCSPTLSRFAPCGLSVNSLDYAVTDF